MEIVLYKSSLANLLQKLQVAPLGKTCGLVTVIDEIGDSVDELFLNGAWNSDMCATAGEDGTKKIKQALIDWKNSEGAECAPGVDAHVGAFDLSPTIEHIFCVFGRMYESSAQDPADSAVILTDCYCHALLDAESLGCDALILPSIMTGRHHFPLDRAAEIVASLFARIQRKETIKTIVLVDDDAQTIQAYDRAFVGRIQDWEARFPAKVK